MGIQDFRPVSNILLPNDPAECSTLFTTGEGRRSLGCLHPQTRRSGKCVYPGLFLVLSLILVGYGRLKEIYVTKMDHRDQMRFPRMPSTNVSDVF